MGKTIQHPARLLFQIATSIRLAGGLWQCFFLVHTASGIHGWTQDEGGSPTLAQLNVQKYQLTEFKYPPIASDTWMSFETERPREISRVHRSRTKVSAPFDVGRRKRRKWALMPTCFRHILRARDVPYDLQTDSNA